MISRPEVIACNTNKTFLRTISRDSSFLTVAICPCICNFVYTKQIVQPVHSRLLTLQILRVFICQIKASYLDTEQNIFPKAKLCQMQIELYIKQCIPNEHDVYYFDAQAIYVNVRKTENSEIRILVKYNPLELTR